MDDIYDFCSYIEKIMVDNVRGNYPLSWREDFISMGILKDLTLTYKNVTLNGFKNIIKLDCSAFKLSGTPETSYGDIAILINVFYPDGSNVEGVAFLEAKKRESCNY